METYDYSLEEIEEIADRENLRYDKERLEKIIPLDAYDYAEKILGITFDWKYLTPTGKLDGVTFFNNCKRWVWPCRFYDGLPSKEDLLNEYTPIELPVRARTIIIDQSILDQKDKYKETFTVSHECGHVVCHPKGFDMATCEKWEPYKYGSYIKMTPIQKLEQQANRFAAALIMPKKITIKTYNELLASDRFTGLWEISRKHEIIKLMASKFEVEINSMLYRLKDLKLIPKYFVL